MATKKSAPAEEIFQVKVTLRWTKPPIWRRLHVPSSLTLAQLHEVLQSAMGWEDCHMHEFSKGEMRFGRPDPEGELMGLDPTENERVVQLGSVLQRTGAKMLYTYDFGDGWEHEIVLEKKLPPDAAATYPLCVDGQLAGPPEDCGGIPGFYRILDILAHPKHKEQREIRSWIGDYDPKTFSVEAVNKALTRNVRSRKQ